MTDHLPLNGDALLGAARSALAPATALHAALRGEDLPDDAPDGTGAMTKSASRVSDPSQGRSGTRRKREQDPLVQALLNTRSASTRSRF